MRNRAQRFLYRGACGEHGTARSDCAFLMELTQAHLNLVLTSKIDRV